MIQSVSLTQLFLFIIIATNTTTTVGWCALGNKLAMSSNSSESLNSDDAEEIEKGARGNEDQEDMDRHPDVTCRLILINICVCYVLII